MMARATHLLVGNPTAQSGKNAERIERALELLGEASIAAALLPTEPEGRTVAAVREALDAGDYRVVISMGGDGTFREVASGLLGSTRRESVALGMLPTGTANDQGKSFGLGAAPADLARNVAVIAAGHETRLDAGHLEVLSDAGEVMKAEAFFDSAGWGISARVLAVRNRDRQAVAGLSPLDAIYRDHLVYAGALLRVFLESYVSDDKFDATLTADGEQHELSGLTDLIVKATRIYGGAWVFDRTCRHDDGLFEVVPFRGKRDWTSKAIVDLDGNPVTEEHLNAIGIEHSHAFRAANIHILLRARSSDVPLAAQIDGEELVASGQARISVEARALRLIVPRDLDGDYQR